MSLPIFRSDMGVELVQHIGTDQTIIQAAKVSTLGSDALDANGSQSFIDFLAKNRHGSPFEHVSMTFLIQAPIFVWREIMRHRIASYNEESGRYKKLEPVFYIPDVTRDLVQVGKPGHYTYEGGTPEQYGLMEKSHMNIAQRAYFAYEELLDAGIAKEVARMSLPLNIYSSAFVTMNARALMNFLSLRTKSPDYAQFQSFPQKEITMVADKMEEHFVERFPMVWRAWDKAGRVAP